MATTVTTPWRNSALVAARVVAGLRGTVQFAGAIFFSLIAPDEPVWVGPWLDVPNRGVDSVTGFSETWVGLPAGADREQAMTMGFLAVALGVAVTLVKITVYDDPEGVVFLLFDAILLGLLTLAWRAEKR